MNISKPTLRSKAITSGFQTVLLPYLGSPHIQYGNVSLGTSLITGERSLNGSDSAEIWHFPAVAAGAHLKCRTQLALPRACGAVAASPPARALLQQLDPLPPLQGWQPSLAGDWSHGTGVGNLLTSAPGESE